MYICIYIRIFGQMYYMHESCYWSQYVTSHIWMSRVPLLSESCLVDEYIDLKWVMSHPHMGNKPICREWEHNASMWCSVLQCVAVCCSVLQRVAVCCNMVHRVAACCSVLTCVAVCCNTVQCVVVCCSVLQCVVVCCSVLQRVSTLYTYTILMHESGLIRISHVAQVNC